MSILKVKYSKMYVSSWLEFSCSYGFLVFISTVILGSITDYDGMNLLILVVFISGKKEETVNTRT